MSITSKTEFSSILSDPGPSTRRGLPSWVILAVVLLLEAISFHRLVVRDIEGLYPFSFDQAGYLSHSYEAFETIRNRGIVDGLADAWFSSGHATGVLLQGEAAILYMFFGASRTTSLMLLFAHFAALQLALFAALRYLTGRTAPGFLAVGLLLFSASRFFYAGGLNDFRLDLPASCLYGIALCCFLSSDRF